MATGIGYRRISSDPTDAGLGVERQRAHIDALAKAHGAAIVADIVGNDESASKAVRPSFDRLLAAIAEHRPDYVFASDPDRLYRRVGHLELLADASKLYGFRVFTDKGELPLDTLITDIGAAVNKDYARQVGIKVRDKHAELRDAGKPFVGGRRPYGYSGGGKGEGTFGMSIVEDEAAIIREAAQRLIAGESARRIATDLGFPGGLQGMRRVLTNGRIAGRMMHKGNDVGEAAWPAILDRATFDAVQAVYATRPTKHGRNHQSLLAGIIRCGLCHMPMIATSRKPAKDRPTTLIYRCDRNAGGCGKMSRDRKWLDDYVTDVALNSRMMDALADAEIAAAGASAEVERITAEVAETERKEKTLTEQWAANRIPDSTYFDAVSALGKQRATLTKEAAALRATEAQALGVMAARQIGADEWAGMTMDEKRDYIKSLYPVIIVNRRETAGPMRPADIHTVDFRD